MFRVSGVFHFIVNFKPCEDCKPCYSCFKSFECGTACTNPMRCTVDNKPRGFSKTKSDKGDYRTKKIMGAAKQICPIYLKEHGIYNLLLCKDHVSVISNLKIKNDPNSLLNMELNYLTKRFDIMYKDGLTSVNWRKM